MSVKSTLDKIHDWKRAPLNIALALSVVASPLFMTIPAHAVTFSNDYPDMDAVDCSGVFGQYFWCKNSTPHSARGYDYRNCTDGAAYWVTKYTGRDVRGWHNATTWDEYASGVGYTVKANTSNSIEPGDIAQRDGTYGHVGFVTAIDKDSNGVVTSITVAELNYDGNGNYRISSQNKGSWDHFIDVNGAGFGLGNEVLSGGGSPVGLNQNVKLNDDSRADFVTARTVGGFTVAYGTPNGTLSEGPLSLTNWTVPSWAGIADTNGDGYSDILVAQPNGGFGLALGHGNGTFTEGGVTLSGWGTGTWAGTGNFYGDSRGDLVVARSTGGFAVAYGTANGTLAEGPVSLTNWSVGSWAGTGDFNGDGYTDVLVAQANGGFAVALGHADGIFTEGGAMLSGWSTGGWGGTGNFSGDSRTDLVVARSTGGFAVATGTPNGTLMEGPVSLTNWSISSWAGTGDFNGDGYTDILVAQPNGGFALALGHADGIFTEGGVTLSGWGTGSWASNGAFLGTKGYGYTKP